MPANQVFTEMPVDQCDWPPRMHGLITKTEREIELIYTNRTKDDAIFLVSPCQLCVV